MRKLKLTYLLVITILGGVLLIVLPTQVQAADSNCNSTTDLGKTCTNPVEVCKDVSGTPTCVCRWGHFEVIDTLSSRNICELLGPSGSSPRGVIINVLNYIIAAITALVIMTAMVSIVIGGYIYMTAGGSADRVGTAKKWIMAAILGIIIALSAWIILAAINPNLI